MIKLVDPLSRDDPLMKQARDALKLYHDSMRSGESEEIIALHKREAESLFQAISDYYQRAMSSASVPLH